MDITKENAAGQSGASNVHFLRKDYQKHSNPQDRRRDIRITDDPVIKRAVNHLYRQGPRMILELLSALAEKHMRAQSVEAEIKRFALLPPGTLRSIGCDQIQHFNPLEAPHE